MNKRPGVTLFELILSIGISAIVLLIVYTGFNLSIKVAKRVEARLDYNAREIIFQLSKDIRSAYLSGEKDSIFRFHGGSAMMNFITVAQLRDAFTNSQEFDLREVGYSLDSKKDNTLRRLIYRIDITPDKDITTGGESEEISTLIKSLSFSYYDGTSWSKVWNSQDKLPKAVRISLELSSKKDLSISKKFSSVVNMQNR